MIAFKHTLFVISMLAAVPTTCNACDDLVGSILAANLRPAIEDLDCSVLKKAGLDKKGHKLNGVCYESSGPASHVRVDTSLNCHTSDKALIPSSVSENVSVDADVRGVDCQVTDIRVKPSGELGKALTSMFGANGKAREALQKGLNQACKR
ncbi:hypothetical protein [Methylobacterium sp. D54C]